MRDTEKAFRWIVEILERNTISYKISGGFAARLHGSDRELADIDIEVADEDVRSIARDAESYIIFGPARYKDANWDLELLTLSYAGQEIDIAGKDAKIFNQKTKAWEVCSSDLSAVEMKEVFGKRVPIETRESLIAYKTKLGREVDIEDVRQLKALRSSADL